MRPQIEYRPCCGVTQWLRESVQCLDDCEAMLSAEESLLIHLDFSRDIH